MRVPYFDPSFLFGGGFVPNSWMSKSIPLCEPPNSYGEIIAELKSEAEASVVTKRFFN